LNYPFFKALATSTLKTYPATAQIISKIKLVVMAFVSGNTLQLRKF